MSIVTIQVTRDGTKYDISSVTAEEKAALVKRVSQFLLDALNNPLDATYVIIDEVDAGCRSWGGLPALEYRPQRADLSQPANS
jgi:4-oxalocrotonate tautomerase